MNHVFRVAVLAAVAIGAACGASIAQDEKEQALMSEKPVIADLAWLAGHWKGAATDGKTWETVYTSPLGGEILSASKELKPDGSLAMFEYERFTTHEGTVKMIPHPFGKARTPFPLKSLDREKRVAVFELPEHDFPRTITYARVETGLRISLTGEMGGQPIDLAIELAPME